MLQFKNELTLNYCQSSMVPKDKLFSHSGYRFNIEDDIYPLLVLSKKIINPYTNQPLWSNDEDKFKIFRHKGLSNEQTENLFRIFKFPSLNNKDKDIICSNKNVLYQLVTTGLILFNDHSNDYSSSLIELSKLIELLPNNIKNMKRIIQLSTSNDYIYDDTLKNYLSQAYSYCIHDVGHTLLQFYIFNYILYFKRNLKEWVKLRNAILDEWSNKKTFSMTLDKEYGYSEGNYLFS